MDLNLENKVVIVTGGAAGIGRATTEAFSAEGANVTAWDVSGSPSPSSAFAKADMTKPERV